MVRAERHNGAVIVDCAVYQQGSRVPHPIDNNDLGAALHEAEERDGFLWIGLHHPDEQEMTRIADAFGLHQLAVEDAVRAHQRPKLERYDGPTVFMVLKTLWYVDSEDAVETGEIAVFVGPRYVVTVRHGEGLELGEVRRDLEQRGDVLGHGPFAVLYSVCDRVVDGYEEVAAELETDVDEIEISVFSDTRTSDSRRIYTLKREVAEFRRAVAPLREPLLAFAQCRVVGMPTEAAAFFRDVSDHAIRVHDQIESLDSLLSSAHDAHLARVTVQQNDDMRKISAYVAMAAVPTLIAGIYGMNFDHMPELRWQYGYPLVMVVMALIVLGLWRIFKRSGWL
jgi:magnesium transporter